MHPNCLCATAPYMDTTVFEEWLEHIDEGIPFEEWKKQNDNFNSKVKFPLDIQFFAKKSNSCDTIPLNKQEFAMVVSELNTNLTKEELKKK